MSDSPEGAVPLSELSPKDQAAATAPSANRGFFRSFLRGNKPEAKNPAPNQDLPTQEQKPAQAAGNATPTPEVTPEQRIQNEYNATQAALARVKARIGTPEEGPFDKSQAQKLEGMLKIPLYANLSQTNTSGEANRPADTNSPISAEGPSPNPSTSEATGGPEPANPAQPKAESDPGPSARAQENPQGPETAPTVEAKLQQERDNLGRTINNSNEDVLSTIRDPNNPLKNGLSELDGKYQIIQEQNARLKNLNLWDTYLKNQDSIDQQVTQLQKDRAVFEDEVKGHQLAGNGSIVENRQREIADIDRKLKGMLPVELRTGAEAPTYELLQQLLKTARERQARRTAVETVPPTSDTTLARRPEAPNNDTTLAPIDKPPAEFEPIPPNRAMETYREQQRGLTTLTPETPPESPEEPAILAELPPQLEAELAAEKARLRIVERDYLKAKKESRSLVGSLKGVLAKLGGNPDIDPGLRLQQKREAYQKVLANYTSLQAERNMFLGPVVSNRIEATAEQQSKTGQELAEKVAKHKNRLADPANAEMLINQGVFSRAEKRMIDKYNLLTAEPDATKEAQRQKDAGLEIMKDSYKADLVAEMISVRQAMEQEFFGKEMALNGKNTLEKVAQKVLGNSKLRTAIGLGLLGGSVLAAGSGVGLPVSAALLAARAGLTFYGTQQSLRGAEEMFGAFNAGRGESAASQRAAIYELNVVDGANKKDSEAQGITNQLNQEFGVNFQKARESGNFNPEDPNSRADALLAAMTQEGQNRELANDQKLQRIRKIRNVNTAIATAAAAATVISGLETLTPHSPAEVITPPTPTGETLDYSQQPGWFSGWVEKMVAGDVNPDVMKELGKLGQELGKEVTIQDIDPENPVLQEAVRGLNNLNPELMNQVYADALKQLHEMNPDLGPLNEDDYQAVFKGGLKALSPDKQAMLDQIRGVLNAPNIHNIIRTIKT
jgi:hypothetical protein